MKQFNAFLSDHDNQKWLTKLVTVIFLFLLLGWIIWLYFGMQLRQVEQHLQSRKTILYNSDFISSQGTFNQYRHLAILTFKPKQ